MNEYEAIVARNIVKMQEVKTSILEHTGKQYVYILVNPAWPSWCKLGKTQDLSTRLNSFNVGSPHRDFNLEHTILTDHALFLEARLHRWLKKHSQFKCEWFELTGQEAYDLIQEYLEKEELW